MGSEGQAEEEELGALALRMLELQPACQPLKMKKKRLLPAECFPVVVQHA